MINRYTLIRSFMLPILLSATLLSLISSCNGSSSNVSRIENTDNEYAELFAIKTDDKGDRFLIINETWNGSSNPKEYRLVERSERKNGIFTEDEIPVPLQSVACMSTTHIAYISALEKTDIIKAVSGAGYVSNPDVTDKITKGEVKDIGYEAALNYELLIATQPDILFTYGISGQDNQHLKKLKELGIRHLVIGDYLENHPLGKLEYLKLFGALLGCYDSADSTYKVVSGRYIEIKESIAEFADKKAKVLMNAPWRDIWYIPGNDNYMSFLVRDAGGELLGSRPGEYISFPYGFEEIILKAYEADYWLNPNSYATMQELSAVSPLFSKLPVFKPGKVFNNIKQNTPQGGSNFWEQGVVEPDIILKDLVTILHPEVYGTNKRDNLKYYIELK
jgi:ABC-type Fe3+-hydroxamate transport system, periplasmic component